MVPEDDWRRMGQEKYLMGVKLRYELQYRPYAPNWEHEHCEFCGQKISPYEGDQHSGYCTLDSYYWICEQCFEDFREEFGFQVQQESQDGDSSC